MGARPLTPLGLKMLGTLPPVLQGSVDYQAVIHACSRELDRLESCAEQVRSQFSPQTADILLNAWELETGLPIGGNGASIAQRQQATTKAVQQVLGAGSGLTWEQRITDLIGQGWSYAEHVADPSVNRVLNPSAEYDTPTDAPAAWSTSSPSYFVSSGATLVVQAAGGVFGPQYIRLTTTAAHADEGMVASLGTLDAGDYVASVYMRGDAGGEPMQLYAGAAVDDLNEGIDIAPSTNWQRYDVQFTADGSHAQYLVARTSSATVVNVDVDAAAVTSGDLLIPYFDGDTVNYEWTGTSGDSTSEFSNPDEATLRITLPFAPDGPLYDQTLVKIRQWTAAHLAIEFASAGGFILDESQLDLQELGN